MDTSELKQELEMYLNQHFKNKSSYNKILYDAMSYSLNIGGKRIRPTLLLLVYSLYRDDYKSVLPVAAAIEMIHTYSLIHDDLPCMDNDDLRRGKPTCHKVYGEAMAVLAGDGLLNEAMNIMFEFSLQKGNKELNACSLISHAAGSEGMIGGQVVDMLSEGRPVSGDELLYMHNKKTGELIKASILAGSLLADAPLEDIEILSQYGEKLGLAFQIKDDILDVTGSTEKLGKNVMSDIDNAKTTFVSTYGLERCKDMCTALTDECLMLIEKLQGNTKYLKELTNFLLKRDY